MGIQLSKPYTPGTRTRSSLVNDYLTTSILQKSLTKGKKRCHGRNNRGVITLKGRGGGHKRKYRLINFSRNYNKTPAKVHNIQYDPNRNAEIALLYYTNGVKKFIISPKSLKIGTMLLSGPDVPIKIGNSLPLMSIPLGTIIHNIEFNFGKGSQIARAAGTYARVMAKENNFVILKLPSSEIRLVNKNCFASIGQVGNFEVLNVRFGKAGRRRWLGYRPKVRGVVKNPNDHPHGGGEGRSPIGRVKPSTPWGKTALGLKTRNPKKTTTKYIVKTRV
jgi:large subunit ribosomal protein L2